MDIDSDSDSDKDEPVAATSKKKGRYAQKYKSSWEKEAEFIGWLKSSSKGAFFAYCTACHVNLSLNAGKRDLKSHAKGGGGRQTLQHFNSRIRLQQKSAKMKKAQRYDYFLVLDFEATCDDGKKINPQEIIEFPVLKVNAKTYEVEDTFQQFVRPVHHPNLTAFCTHLTTITQEEVNSAKVFQEVFQDFRQWMEEKVGLDKRFLFVTCGDWDLKTMLPSQCALYNIPVPPYCKVWLNIKKSYAIKKGDYVKGMYPMLDGLNLKAVGTPHRGIDDCKNIANILRALANLQCEFLPTYYVE